MHWLEDDGVMPSLDGYGEGVAPQIQGTGGM
jgi:hypothetical protein